MKPNEIAKLFSEYLESGTTAKGVKIKSFFNYLPTAQKRLVAKNIEKANASFLQEEKHKSDLRKRQKKEISDLKKKAKELGLVISEA